MTKEAAEKEYQRKFCEAKLDEHFELIQRDWTSYCGRKVLVRCKECGELFHTWNVCEVFKGDVKRLICPSCGQSSDGGLVWLRSKECDEAMKFYVQGHSVRETAERFGVTRVQINNAVKARKLTNGRTFRDGPSEHNKKLKKEAEERLKAVLESKGFVYCGGYTDRDGKVEIACKTCGAKFTRTLPIIYHGSLVCLKCKSITHRQELKRLNEERKEQKRIELEQQKREREASKAEALFHLLNDKTHICTVCGKSFSIADYMEDCGLKQIQRNPSYCSNACKRRLNHRKSKECKKRSGNYDRGNHRHRARKYGVAYEPGITLKKVFKRDNGICQICGKPCDWSDRGWNKYCGPTYPSTDHIIPLDKGGGHVWENVQLAHMMCNSEKGDKLLKAVIS